MWNILRSCREDLSNKIITISYRITRNISKTQTNRRSYKFSKGEPNRNREKYSFEGR